MEIFSNNSTSFLSTILLTFPLMWGVYEFRKFRFQLEDIKKKANEISKKIDDITKNKLEKIYKMHFVLLYLKYPLHQNLKYPVLICHYR